MSDPTADHRRIEPHDLSRFEHVLVAVDGTSPDQDAAVLRLALQAAPDAAELTLMIVAPTTPVPAPADMAGLTAVQEAGVDQDVLDGLARERLQDVAALLPAGRSHHERVSWGPIAAAIADELENGGPYDLAVVGHHARSELSIIFHGGSVAHGVLRRSPVEVVVREARS